VTYPKDCKDANDVLMAHGVGAVALLMDEARPIVPKKLVKFSDIPMDNRVSYGVGWAGLEDHMRLRSPELVIFTGAAGSGKSQFALNIGANLARIHGLKGAILQFEDHPERNREDLLTYATAWRQEIERPDVWVDTMFRTIAPAEVTGADERYTLEWLTNTIREAARVHGCKWVCIDPWNEVEHLWGLNENESAYTNRALAELKSLARLLQITLMIVTHPSKSGAVKTEVSEISLYDVAGSAAWKNKADHGVILIRQEGTNDVYVKVDKVKDHRRMGFPGTVRMRFNPRTASYDYLGKGI
jgi:twinkle protein